MRKSKFIVVTHAVLSSTEDIAGPAHNIVSYIDKKNIEYLFIRHPLFKGGSTLIAHKKGNKLNEYSIEPKKQIGEIVNRALEGIRTIKIYLDLIKKNEKSVYIGIDPLNSLWGLILKKLGRVDVFISFTVDYSPRRFQNRVLNYIYHLIDRITLRESDKAWVVSARIYNLRIKQGKKRKDLFLVPNAPSFNEIKSFVKKNSNPLNLITIGTISRALDFYLIIDSVLYLKNNYPKIKLTIIGEGKGMSDLKNYIKKKKLEKNVNLLGAKTHDEVFRNLSNQGIGIAIYTDDAPWSYYSDSMKARDYLALGLPVIISGNIGTAEEIKDNNAGIVVKKQRKDLTNAIKKFISDKKYYNSIRKNALKMAEETDIEKFLDRAIMEDIGI